MTMRDPYIVKHDGTVDADGVQRSLEDLVRQLDTGGRQVKLRFGVTTISFAAAISASTTVTHGMGSTPLVVLGGGIGSTQMNITVSAIGATTFSLDGRFTDEVARTVTITAHWIALG